MKLRELVEKIDNDIFLFIIGGSESEPEPALLFKRKHASDVIPENLLNMEVGSFFNEFNSLYIYVRRNSRKGSFRELLLLQTWIRLGGSVQRAHEAFLLDLPNAGRERSETSLPRFS